MALPKGLLTPAQLHEIAIVLENDWIKTPEQLHCKGCGRHYLEVAHWNEMTQAEKDAVWQLDRQSNRSQP